MPRRALASSPIQTPGAAARGFLFALEESGDPPHLALRALHRPTFGAITTGWDDAEMQRRIAAGRRQPLARAAGLHRAGEDTLSILDATAGLGRDAYTLAALGARLTLAERNPELAALLRDAQRRAAETPAQAAIAARIEILEADAAKVLRDSQRWDVVYVDPMYPDEGRRALPSKEMQILRELTGGGADADALLAPALECARLRVVVKRPLKAKALADRPPSMSLRTTQLRFDVYLIHI